MKKSYTMKKKNRWLRYLVSSVLLLCWQQSYAQPASSYSHTAVAGTFTEITGGTNVTSILGDDVQSATINLGFTFNFCGVNYSDIKANSNGWITFGNGTSDVVIMRENNTTNLNALKPLLMPLWDDNDGASGTAMYQVAGTAPNRVFTFQFKNWEWAWNSLVNISYQVKLYETTNIIEYIYRQETNAGSPANTSGCTIGIADGAATPTYLTLNNSTATPAASATTFTTSIVTRPATGQIYRFTPPVPCTAATAPAVTGINAVPTAICLSGNTNLSLPITMPAATGYTYQWQRSTTTATGPFFTIANTTAATYSAPVTQTSYYRCRVLCNNDSLNPFWVSTASQQVVVTDPGTPTVTPGSRCGPGVVSLSATLPAGASVLNWYAAPTGGIPLNTGTTFTTPAIPATTNFYVAAATGPGSGPVVKITEMDLGATDGLEIQNVGSSAVDVTGWKVAISNDYNSITVVNPIVQTLSGTMAPGAIKFWNDASGPNYWGNNILWNPGTFPTYTGWILLLDNNDNLVDFVAYNWPVATIQATTLTIGAATVNLATAWTGVPLDGNNAAVQSGSSFQRTGNADLNMASDFSVATPTVGTANTGLVTPFPGGACEGVRVAVTATVNASPAVSRTSPAVACNNTSAAIVLTPPAPPYANYNWLPVTNLYTDAAATIPYLGGSATTVYMKTTNVGPQTYYMMAGNPNSVTGCTFADTVKIWSQPGNVGIKAFPDTICMSGTSKLSLDTIAGYAPGSIQWQDSIPGTSASFTDIAGATSPVYTTPTLSFGQDRYYRAQIKSSNGICEAPVKYVVIANPSIVSAPDSFNCGPGTVTLDAQVGGYANVRWYSSPTASLPIGTGTPWTTPFLGATTTYYVEAGTGSIQPPPTFIGNGAFDDWWGYLPYFGAYNTANKAQWMVTAAEMQAAGFSAGYITQLAFDVTTKSGTTNIANLTYRMKAVTGSALGATFHTNLQEVFTTANYNPTANAINVHTLQTPFYWDGQSSIVLEECSSNPTNQYGFVRVKYNAAPCLYYYTDQTANTNANCGTPAGTYSTNVRPNIRFTMLDGCRSAREPVIAFIHPKPTVDLGPDINECVDQGAVKVLDAGVQPNNGQYLWDNGSNSQVRAVSTSGTYMVTVTNQYTCANSDTINVLLRKNPVVNLGNDTTVCNGVVLSLDAGDNGINYFWSTGENSQVIEVNDPGSYNVFVTNNLGCIKADTIVVNMAGELPTISGINISNNGVSTFYFTAVNPQNVIGYDWDFGDGTPHSYQVSPTHTYANGGNYVVVLRLSSTCGFFDDTTSAHIVGINPLNVNNDELMVYPNPSHSTATLLNKGALKMEKIEIYTTLGQIVYTAKADSKDKHTMQLGGLASGIYTIQVYTDKGTVARKLEILK